MPDPRLVAEKECRYAAEMLHRQGRDTYDRLADAGRAVTALHVALEHASRHRESCQRIQDELEREVARESAISAARQEAAR